MDKECETSEQLATQCAALRHQVDRMVVENIQTSELNPDQVDQIIPIIEGRGPVAQAPACTQQALGNPLRVILKEDNILINAIDILPQAVHLIEMHSTDQACKSFMDFFYPKHPVLHLLELGGM
uniref:Uncharacterized protein n=1 Tax=Romanomermis culicivorax TaxID=13658 RepID=A0A915ITT2_ROMCU